MTQALAENRRNASVCGCSSMVEQKLPKLLTSAETGHPASKTRHETSVSFQSLSFRAQNKLARQNGNSDGPTKGIGGARG